MIQRRPFRVEPCAWHFWHLLLHQNVVSMGSSAGPVAALHFSSSLWAGEDILTNKHFLVCHSHTPTHSVAPVSTPSDNVTSAVRCLNKLKPLCTRESLRASYLLMYLFIFSNCMSYVGGHSGVSGLLERWRREREMHQPGTCQDFYFHARVCPSARTCVWCRAAACHILCTCSIFAASQQCFVSMLQPRQQQMKPLQAVKNPNTDIPYCTAFHATPKAEFKPVSKCFFFFFLLWYTNKLPSLKAAVLLSLY